MMRCLRFTATIICATAMMTAFNQVAQANARTYLAAQPKGSMLQVIALQDGLPPKADITGPALVDQPENTSHGMYNGVPLGADTAQLAAVKVGDKQVLKPDTSKYMEDYYPSGNVGYSTSQSPLIRVSVSIARSRRLSSESPGIPGNMQNFRREHKNGYALGVDLGFRMSDRLYLGPRFDHFGPSSSKQVRYYISSTQSLSGEIKETLAINFYALQLTQMLSITQGKSQLSLSAALGYLHYVKSGISAFWVDPNVLEFKPYSLRGGNLGLRLAVGYDLHISSDTKITLGLGCVAARITNFAVDIGSESSVIDLDPQEYESFVRLDAGIAFTWMF